MPTLSIGIVCRTLYHPQNSLEHSVHVQKGPLDDNAQEGQRGSRGCVAADPVDTSDGSLKYNTQKRTQNLGVALHNFQTCGQFQKATFFKKGTVFM